MNHTETSSYRPAGRLNGRAPTGASRAAPRRLRPSVAARVVPRALATALALAALVAFSALAAHSRPAPKVAVVMDASVAHDPALRAEAETWLRRSAPAGAARIAARVPAGATQQLSVTSTLATRGYDTIVAIGLDSRVALDPVVRRYRDLRVVRWPGAI
jgi:anti-sigma factor RsiW